MNTAVPTPTPNALDRNAPRPRDLDDRRALRYLAGLLLLSTVVRGFFSWRLGLGDAEAYYWTWSRHLALSYYDHPPMVAWLIALGTSIGEQTLFVRLASLLLFNGVAWLLFGLTREITGRANDGLVAVAILHVVPAFFIGGMTATPDIPLAFFWLAAIRLYDLAVRRDRPPLFLAAGVAVGLAFLSKYFAILLPIVLLVHLSHRERRHYLRTPWPWLGALVALGATGFVIAWNVQHHWASTHYHLVARHHHVGPSLQLLGKVIGGQLGYITPLFLIFFLSTLFWLRRERRDDPGGQLLFVSSIIPLVVLGVISSITDESEPHWPVMGYLPLCAALAWRYETLPLARRFSTRVQRLRKAAVWFSLGLMGLFMIHVSTPALIRLLPASLYQPKVDITNELYGWPALGAAVERLRRVEGASFAMSYHYTMCSQLNYATGDRIPVLCPNHRLDQFDFMTDERSFYGKTGLFVGDNRYRRPPAEAVICRKLEKLEELDVYRGTTWVRRFTIYRCAGFSGVRPKTTGLSAR
ncbi:MAG: glycosyltransferase family 39 protein [Myxococcales bacterium]|nr:glycosyltransferase family 39 protein [Myxococcales bacterium]